MTRWMLGLDRGLSPLRIALVGVLLLSWWLLHLVLALLWLVGRLLARGLLWLAERLWMAATERGAGGLEGGR